MLESPCTGCKEPYERVRGNRIYKLCKNTCTGKNKECRDGQCLEVIVLESPCTGCKKPDEKVRGNRLYKFCKNTCTGKNKECIRGECYTLIGCDRPCLKRDCLTPHTEVDPRTKTKTCSCLPIICEAGQRCDHGQCRPIPTETESTETAETIETTERDPCEGIVCPFTHRCEAGECVPVDLGERRECRPLPNRCGWCKVQISVPVSKGKPSDLKQKGRKCPKCGNKIPYGAVRCPKCGYFFAEAADDGAGMGTGDKQKLQGLGGDAPMEKRCVDCPGSSWCNEKTGDCCASGVVGPLY